MRDLAIRTFTVFDLDLASTIHRSTFDPMGERGWTRQDIAELVAAPGVIGLFVESAREKIGFALGRVAGNEAEILTIVVNADHRRRGAGRSLLEAMIDRMRAAGAITLYLDVGADNPAARALYERIGFVVAGHRAGYYRRGEAAAADAIVMRLTLKPVE